MRGERTARGQHRAERRQIAFPLRFDAFLFQHGEILGAGPENRHPFRLGHSPQHARIRAERCTIVEYNRCAKCQTGDQPIPHHPPARGEVEDHVIGSHIRVQCQLFPVLQQGAARTMHHALGKAGRSGRVQNVERMIKRQARKDWLSRVGISRSHDIESLSMRDSVQHRFCVTVGHHPHGPQRRNCRHNLPHTRETVDMLARILVAVGDNQHDRLNLLESIKDATCPKIR